MISRLQGNSGWQEWSGSETMQLDHLVRMTMQNGFVKLTLKAVSQATFLMLHAFLSVQDCSSGLLPQRLYIYITEMSCREPV